MRFWLHRAVRCAFVLSLSVLSADLTSGQEGGPGLHKTNDDTDKNTTSVGNIALTVSNFGTIGTRNAYWPDQPSCEYPRGSRIEHLYQGGLWVGAVSRHSGQIHVSTGSSDRVSTTTGKGFEFTSDYGSD